MAHLKNNLINTSFLPDPEYLRNMQLSSADFKELMVRLFYKINEISEAINDKDFGSYSANETATGKQWFYATTQRMYPVVRKVIDTGQLPNTATKSVPHGIPGCTNIIWTRIEGYATDPATCTGISVNHPSSPGWEVYTWVSNVNVNIHANNNYNAYTKSYVILEYIRV